MVYLTTGAFRFPFGFSQAHHTHSYTFDRICLIPRKALTMLIVESVTCFILKRTVGSNAACRSTKLSGANGSSNDKSGSSLGGNERAIVDLSRMSWKSNCLCNFWPQLSVLSDYVSELKFIANPFFFFNKDQLITFKQADWSIRVLFFTCS